MLVRVANALRAGLGVAPVYTERDLQDRVSAALTKAGIDHQREARLEDCGRPDFMVGRLAIEVKIKGSRMDLIRQVQRYLSHDDVDGALVVTTKLAHHLPDSLYDKPVRVLYLTVFGVR